MTDSLPDTQDLLTVKPYANQGHYTAVHDAVLDVVMPVAPPNAFKILMLVIRKTRGWKKDSDRVSYSLIRAGTGIRSDTTVHSALDWLVTNGHLLRWPRGNTFEAYEYSLNQDQELKIRVRSKPPRTTETVVPPATETVVRPTTEIVETITTVKNQEETLPLRGVRTSAQKLADSLYEQLKDQHGVRQTRKQYSHHLNVFSTMLKQEATEVEAVAVIARLVARLPEYRKYDAVQALNDVRLDAAKGSPPPQSGGDAARRKSGYEWFFDPPDAPEEAKEAVIQAVEDTPPDPWETSQWNGVVPDAERGDLASREVAAAISRHLKDNAALWEDATYLRALDELRRAPWVGAEFVDRVKERADVIRGAGLEGDDNNAKD